MECVLCHRSVNKERTRPFCQNPAVCISCGKRLVEAMFADNEFNEWLDSFLQSRIEKHIKSYDEYYTRYKKQKCPDCNGTGFIARQVCKRCNFVGVIDANP